MVSDRVEPLGFSDLTPDEELLIVLFRDWQRRGPTRAVEEHALARILQSDKFYPALSDVFFSFGKVAETEARHIADGILLSATEEKILTEISSVFGDDAPRCVPPQIDARVRSAADIARSGHDGQFGELDCEYWQAAAEQARKPKPIH
ncbi:MAG: hypothetical protein AAFQ04_01555 [Pseudomonadota bacterium]